MSLFNHPFMLKDITAGTANGTAADISIKGRNFLLANKGAQPLYFKEKNGVACTATNGMLVPAGTVFPVMMTADTLSIISNATTTTYAFLFMDQY